MPDSTELAPARGTRLSHWAERWVSIGGAVTLAGIANLVAALNWNAITKGFSSAPGSIDLAHAAAAADRYALWGFALLIIGQQMVTRRALGRQRDHEEPSA